MSLEALMATEAKRRRLAMVLWCDRSLYQGAVEHSAALAACNQVIAVTEGTGRRRPDGFSVRPRGRRPDRHKGSQRYRDGCRIGLAPIFHALNRLLCAAKKEVRHGQAREFSITTWAENIALRPRRNAKKGPRFGAFSLAVAC